ncbi:uncharacterized protein HaLaN_01907, partial [Haematococcus lacustris]
MSEVYYIGNSSTARLVLRLFIYYLSPQQCIPSSANPKASVPGSVEEERSFSAMNFIKDKRRNSLSANLSSTLRVYHDKTFTLKTFLYNEAIDYWMAGASARGRYLGHR